MGEKKRTSPYWAQFGAVHHRERRGFLFAISPAQHAETVANALNRSEVAIGLADALRKIRPFVEAEVENRGSAGSDMSDYQNEAKDALDTIDAALAQGGV